VKSMKDKWESKDRGKMQNEEKEKGFLKSKDYNNKWEGKNKLEN
jgi:hypothetical protein